MINPKPHTLSEDERRQALDAFIEETGYQPGESVRAAQLWVAWLAACEYMAGKAASANEWNSPELVRLRRIAELSGELRRAQLRNARFWNKPGATPGSGFEYLKQSQELDALLSARSAAETLAAKTKTGE